MILGPNGKRLIKDNGKFAVGTDCCCGGLCDSFNNGSKNVTWSLSGSGSNGYTGMNSGYQNCDTGTENTISFHYDSEAWSLSVGGSGAYPSLGNFGVNTTLLNVVSVDNVFAGSCFSQILDYDSGSFDIDLKVIVNIGATCTGDEVTVTATFSAESRVNFLAGGCIGPHQKTISKWRCENNPVAIVEADGTIVVTPTSPVDISGSDSSTVTSGNSASVSIPISTGGGTYTFTGTVTW